MIGLCFWMSNAIVTVLGLTIQMETISDIVRDPSGDFFTVKSDDCHTRGCAKNGRFAETVKLSANQCRCQCSESHPVIRDDTKECVNQLDCSLVNFVRPLLTENIPVVSLPVSSGQLIHPGAHLILAGDDKSINHSQQLLCQIDGSDVMTPKGWKSIGLSDGTHAFELFENGNNTFLQWLANDSVRKSLHQKLVLIRLYCSPSDSSVKSLVFKPCVAIRVGWVPGLGVITGRESSDQNKAFNNQNTNYSMIGLCLGLLGVMYVSALMVYMRSKHTEDVKYDERHVTHRWPTDSEDSQTMTNPTTDISNHSSDFRVSSPEYDSLNNLESETRSTPTDWSPPLPSIDYNTSDESLDNSEEVTQKQNTSKDSTDSQSFSAQNPIYEKRLQKPDRIPRHCLRISPELFEPQLLLDPPPTAVEMLQKIRDLISIAKTRLRNFRFRPSLVVIPEDDYFYNEYSNKCVVFKHVVNPNFTEELETEGTVSVGTEEHIIEIDDENHSIISTDINIKHLKSDLNNSLIKEPNNEMNENQSFSDNESQFKSFSRKQMLNNIQLSDTHTINDLNFNENSNSISEKLIEVKNLSPECKVLEGNEGIYSDIHSLKVISSKVDLYKNFEKQIFNERQVIESSDKRMFSYLRNSLGKFGSKSKPKAEQVLVSSNNWTLQSACAARRARSRTMNQKSVIRKRMTSRRGQLCYNCSDVSSLSGQRLTDTFNDSEQMPSLESNENNESMDSFECCTSEMYSDSEMSTTSSTIRDNQLTSLESELNDNHLSHFVENHTEEHNSIDECLKYLAAASVDNNHDKYYQRIGRASKGMSAIKHLKSGDWNHVCHRSDSELEISQKRSDSKTNVYSKNSKSRIKSSKSLNSNNRQKFKKKLALYKSQTNDVLINRTDNLNSSDVNCCQTTTDQSVENISQELYDIENSCDTNSTVNQLNNTIDCAQNEKFCPNFVIKIKI